MAKKVAHDQALKMFITSKGKTALKAIADEVGVSPLTVGRWHNTEDWKGKIKAIKAVPTRKKRKRAEGVVIRKKALFDKAVKLFRQAGGKVSNAQLLKQLKVSKATLRKWKKLPQWSQGFAVTVSPEPSHAAPPSPAAPLAQTAPASLESITSLQDLVVLNQQLRSMMERSFLTTADIEHLSNAKLRLLEAAEVYLRIGKGKE